MGYPHLLVHGQKGYNGVAIASRLPFKAKGTKVWCGKDDRRHAFVRLEGGAAGTLIDVGRHFVPASEPLYT